MTRATKTLLLIFGSVVAVVVIMLLATVVWWNLKSDGFKTAVKNAANAGFAMGATKDENACVAASFDRMKDLAKQNATSTMIEGFWVAGCLESSKPNERFCEGVPATTSPVAIGQWAHAYCLQKGNNSPYCGGTLTMVPQHCATPERAQKVKVLVKPAG